LLLAHRTKTKKGDENDNLVAMEAPDTGKKEHDGKEETKQHNHSHHNHHNHREEHVGGRKIDLVNYVVGLGAMATPGAFLVRTGYSSLISLTFHL
jgi:hypothetical protein